MMNRAASVERSPTIRLMPELPIDPAPQSFEGSLAELQQIVHDLEEGNLGLETSLSRFEDGIRLLQNCYRILEQAEQKIEILTGADAAGNPVIEPFDSSATIDATEQPDKKTGRNRGRYKTESHLPSAEPEVAPREQGGLF